MLKDVVILPVRRLLGLFALLLIAGVPTATQAQSDTAPPAVAITSPASGATVSGTIAITAVASDNVGVAGVQFRYNGNNFGPDFASPPYSISADTQTVPNGTYVLTAVARDAAGNATVSTPVTITVSNGTGPPTGQEFMPPSPTAWRAFAPRGISTPETTSVTGGTGSYTLNINGRGAPSVYGGWTTRLTGLQGGGYYRFTARALPGNITFLREAVTIYLRWRGAFGAEVSPDYIWDFRVQADGTLLYDRVVQAPPGTTSVDVELALQWSSNGQVAFDRLSFTSVAPPPARPVRVAAIYNRPTWSGGGSAAVQQAAAYADQVARNHRPDIMVLGEMLNMTGGSGTPDGNAQTVPGPGTELMASIARSNRIYVVFGLLERSGDLLFNTAVLLDRDGNIAGKYRKVQLPESEVSAGVTPGSSVPIFDTDFGRIALLICQDTSFPEPAREVALQGAELVLVPIWGGRSALVHARAVENGMYVAASGYDYASDVVGPLGTVLAFTTITGAPQQAAVADIDLSRRFREVWLGDWRDLSAKQRRTQPYQYRLP